MKGTGIFITEDERKAVEIARSVSGMFLSDGTRMGDPEWEVAQLVKKYHPPEDAGLNLKTGEFMVS